MTSRQEKWIRRIGPFVIVLLFLCLWQYLADTEKINTFFFSNPMDVILDFIDLFVSGRIWIHLKVTMTEAISGLFIGIVTGVMAAFLFGNFKILSLLFDPIFVAIYGLPKLALGPLFVVWFGLGLKSKIIMSTMMVFFLVFFNAYAGFRDVDIELLNTLKLMGATRIQIVTKVTLPSCVPWIIASLRSGIGASVGGAIMGEYLGTNKGLGFLVQTAGANYDITRVMSVILVMSILMVMLDSIGKMIEKLVLKWRPPVD
ncbi:MAG: ABC transporter permease [bacterium]|nr:ABC transporter permease [bacterium]